WEGTLDEMAGRLRTHGLDMESDSFRLSRLWTLDSATEQFTGEGADAANALLARTYREPFIVPEHV
ncbi:MAG: gfo/Idh/MocA family oxidoreductase, partial [Patescibacteria group bacterium]|nr:gfo/Idh/MocA family oxidoreductase [Patescibacteria group bacterium]